MSNKRWRSRCTMYTSKSLSLVRVRRMGDRLGVGSRRHSRMGVRNHNIWSTTPRKVRILSSPKIIVRGE